MSKKNKPPIFVAFKKPKTIAAILLKKANITRVNFIL